MNPALRVPCAGLCEGVRARTHGQAFDFVTDSANCARVGERGSVAKPLAGLGDVTWGRWRVLFVRSRTDQCRRPGAFPASRPVE